LPILEISREWIEQVRAKLVELPDAKRERFETALGLSHYDASVLVAEQAVAQYYEAMLAAGANPKTAANWLISSFFGLLNKDGIEREDIASARVSAEQLAALTKLVDNGTLNKGTATTVLEDMWATGADPEQIVNTKGLAQVSDESVIADAVVKVLQDHAAMVQEYLSGKDKLFSALMGACMKALKGKGDPKVVTEMLRKHLEGRRR
jgi:aspartyl-tRNA(Asn)/glutamyl-tRNA(Gln) amidotransferase subunit B